MVLSPLNPLKAKPEELLADADRLEMLRLACEPYPELEACDIELSLPRPSYTVDTLRKLSELHPGDEFRLIIGADNYVIFPKWRDYQEIVDNYSPVVYPREGFAMPEVGSGFTSLNAPLFPLSSTEIRQLLRTGEAVEGYVPKAVAGYILRNNLYGPTDVK